MNKTLRILIASLALASTSHALPVVLYQHTGDTDPTSLVEGWTAPIINGPVGVPFIDSGIPTWKIDNNATSDSLLYRVTPTATQLSDASLGWSLCVSLHVTAPGLSPGGSMIALYRNGTQSYQMHFGSDAAGNVVVVLNDGTYGPPGAGSGGARYTVPGGTGFNTFELIYSDITGDASLFVNGLPTPVLTGYTGFPSAETVLAWGDGSNLSTNLTNLAKANYAKVVFSILPRCGVAHGRIIETVALNGDAVPTAPAGAKFLSLGDPAINSLTHFAFKAQLAVDPAVPVNLANNWGIFADQGPITLNLVARKGSVAVGTAARYLVFSDPVINNSDKVAFIASLGRGATTATNSGIWSDSRLIGTLRLVARKGFAAPGTGGALFENFHQIVLPDVGGTVFLADLRLGTGTPAVTATNNLGVWGTDSMGNVSLLMRVGDLLSMEDVACNCYIDKTLETLSILSCLPHVGAQGRNWEPLGDLGFGATFTDGTSGVYHLKR